MVSVSSVATMVGESVMGESSSEGERAWGDEWSESLSTETLNTPGGVGSLELVAAAMFPSAQAMCLVRLVIAS